jgi:hypothetical protein
MSLLRKQRIDPLHQKIVKLLFAGTLRVEKDRNCFFVDVKGLE